MLTYLQIGLAVAILASAIYCRPCMAWRFEDWAYYLVWLAEITLFWPLAVAIAVVGETAKLLGIT